jgi:hypothetical protein
MSHTQSLYLLKVGILGIAQKRRSGKHSEHWCLTIRGGRRAGILRRASMSMSCLKEAIMTQTHHRLLQRWLFANRWLDRS